MLGLFAALSACASEGNGGGDGPSSSSGADDGPGTTMPSMTSTIGPTDTSTTNADATGPASTAGSTGPLETTGPGDTTAGGGLCTVDLPPPPVCATAAERPQPIAIVPGAEPWNDGYAALPDEVAGGFIVAPDVGPTVQCDPIAQDCPEGQKCMPWANDGGSSWNADKCVPVDPDPAAIGEPCTVTGSGVSGIDDCDVGAMCWGVDAETGMGTCAELCGCSAATPTCDTPDTICTITNGGVLPLCRPACNPFDPMACPDGQGCVPVGDLFVCSVDASGDSGAIGDPCEFINACDPGLFCADAASVPGCGSSGCCSSYCSDGDDTVCLAGQACVPWYQPGDAPDDCLATVGACANP